MQWTKHAASAVNNAWHEVMATDRTLSPDEIAKIVRRDYYPFGEREYWPYKAWLKAVKTRLAVEIRIEKSGLKYPQE